MWFPLPFSGYTIGYTRQEYGGGPLSRVGAGGQWGVRQE